MRVWLVLATVLCGWPVGTWRARAHDPWEGVAVAHNPEAPGMLAVETNRGVLLTNDGGATWRFVCRNLVGRENEVVVAVTSATTLWGRTEGLFEATPAGCAMENVVDMPEPNPWVRDMQRDPLHPRGWYVGTAHYGVPNGVLHSIDDGHSWEAVGELENRRVSNTVRPSADGAHVYVGTSEYIPESDVVLYAVRHRDNDVWTEHEVLLEHDDREGRLLAVDPLNPNRIFYGVRVCQQGKQGCFDPAVGQKNDRVLVSDDAGATWSVLIEVRELGGFAINAQHIWVGDWMGGLWRMNHDGTGATALSGLHQPGCLAVRDNDLLACGGAVTDKFLLARSTDNGETFQPLATVHNLVGAPACGVDDRDGGMDPVAVCAQEWRDLCFIDRAFDKVAIPPTECGELPGLDAGLPAVTRPNDGCGCSVINARRPIGPAGWLACVALLLLTVARTRRRQACAKRAA